MKFYVGVTSVLRLCFSFGALVTVVVARVSDGVQVWLRSEVSWWEHVEIANSVFLQLNS